MTLSLSLQVHARVHAHIFVELSWVCSLFLLCLPLKVINSFTVCLLKILPGEPGTVYRFVGRHIKLNVKSKRNSKNCL